MDLLRRLSIRQKLIVITMTTACAVTVFLASMLVLTETQEKKRSVYQSREKQLAILADIIGSRSTAALVFGDTTTAAENLSSLSALRADHALVLAGIFTPEGELFSEFMSQAPEHTLRTSLLTRNCDTAVEELSSYPLVRVCSPIQLAQEQIGEVRLVYDMTTDLALYRNYLQRFLIGVFIVAIAAMGLAWILSFWLQRIISGPILYLQQAMRQVSSHKDYSVRVSPSGSDELSTLVQGFNQMLKQIQYRDNELAEHRTELQKLVEERTLELQQANQRRILWLENLAHILRHELKSATVGVRSSLDLIERRTSDQSLNKYVERARTSMNYMEKLLDSVGTASTLESSFDQDMKQGLYIGPLLSQQCEVYRAVYPEITIHCCCESDIKIMASEARLVQMLDKLVANAVDYHAPGTPIVIQARAEESTVRLSICNTGSSLPADKHRIFELFVSLRDTRHKQSENFGLGLYIVRLIAESHGGNVSAENLPDCEGVRINVTLPRIEAMITCQD